VETRLEKTFNNRAWIEKPLDYGESITFTELSAHFVTLLKKSAKKKGICGEIAITWMKIQTLKAELQFKTAKEAIIASSVRMVSVPCIGTALTTKSTISSKSSPSCSTIS